MRRTIAVLLLVMTMLAGAFCMSGCSDASQEPAPMHSGGSN